MNNKEFPQQANMPYPYPMPYQDNDEIDLIELFRTLWKQKAKIALVTAVTGAVPFTCWCMIYN